MLNFGWAELMVIGVVALIVIGPEDLPDMFRQMGRFTAKLRAMSRDFSRAMEQAAKETGVKDVAKDLRVITSPKAMGLDAVKSAADKFEKWDPIKNAAKPSVPLAAAKPLVPAPMPATPVAAPSALAETDPEALDDLIDWDAEPVAAQPLHGSATQALYDKQAAKAAVIAEQTAKLKAIDEGTYLPEPTILPPQPMAAAPQATAAAVKPRVAKPKPVATEAAPKPKPVATEAAPKQKQVATEAARKPKPATAVAAPKPARKSSKKADPS